MSLKRIVITGGPGTGKTSIIKELTERNFTCMEEISRQLTLEAQKRGIEQLFLTDPMLFSDRLLMGRTEQFHQAGQYEGLVFLDRGIPDILAYMDFAGESYPGRYVEACRQFTYDHVFILAPWQEIYLSDNERYEDFSQAQRIHDHLLNTYTKYNYELHDVPFGDVSERTDYILNITSSL